MLSELPCPHGPPLAVWTRVRDAPHLAPANILGLFVYQKLLDNLHFIHIVCIRNLRTLCILFIPGVLKLSDTLHFIYVLDSLHIVHT